MGLYSSLTKTGIPIHISVLTSSEERSHYSSIYLFDIWFKELALTAKLSKALVRHSAPLSGVNDLL